MTISDKRKAQFREGSKNTRQRKKDAGFIRWEIWIKESWKKDILGFIEKLKNKGNL